MDSPMNSLEQLLGFTSRLQDADIQFTLHCVRNAVIVAVVSPTTHYEIHFFANGEFESQAWGPKGLVRSLSLEEVAGMITSELKS
jgi:hypothetical protein